MDTFVIVFSLVPGTSSGRLLSVHGVEVTVRGMFGYSTDCYRSNKKG